jgi:hypothetical protein
MVIGRAYEIFYRSRLENMTAVFRRNQLNILHMYQSVCNQPAATEKRRVHWPDVVIVLLVMSVPAALVVITAASVPEIAAVPYRCTCSDHRIAAPVFPY